MSGAGGRADIYTLIDGLSDVGDMRTLVLRLQPILEMLAYDHVHSEARVNEDHEEWRTTYNQRLGSEQSADSATAAAAAAARRSSRLPAAAPTAPQHRPAAVAQARAPPRVSHAAAAPQHRPPPDLNSIPPSLRAILMGQHKSLNESDYNDS
jgi:hypothetical protein